MTNLRTGLTFVFNEVPTVLHKQARERTINLVQRHPRQLKRWRGKYKENRKTHKAKEQYEEKHKSVRVLIWYVTERAV